MALIKLAASMFWYINLEKKLWLMDIEDSILSIFDHSHIGRIASLGCVYSVTSINWNKSGHSGPHALILLP